MIFKHLHSTQLLAVVLTVHFCNCLEEVAPEVFLQPRNFNPHPYQNGYSPRNVDSADQGPVLFPITNDNPEQEEYYNNGLSNRIIDDHPYASVARKKKFQFGVQQRIDETRVNPEVYKALTNHAAKVLSVPAAELKLHSYSNVNQQYHHRNEYVQPALQIPGAAYEIVKSPLKTISGRNYEYFYEIPRANHKPIYEDNSEDPYKYSSPQTQDFIIDADKFGGILQEQKVHYFADVPVREFYDVDNYNYQPNGKGFSQVYIKTPKFRLLQRQNHGSL